MKTLITDDQALTGASTRSGCAIKVYDDGFGPLWVHFDSMGITGLVRARTWAEAYEICADEFFPAADAEAAAERQQIEAMPEGKDREHADACWEEAYGYRSNGRAEADGSVSSIYAKDLNGDRLELLTPALLAELDITLKIESN